MRARTLFPAHAYHIASRTGSVLLGVEVVRNVYAAHAGTARTKPVSKSRAGRACVREEWQQKDRLGDGHSLLNHAVLLESMTQVTDIHSLPDIAYHQGYAPVVVARVARVSPAWRGAASIAPAAPSRTRTRTPSIRAAGAPPRRWRSPAPSAAATTPPSRRRAPHFQALLFFHIFNFCAKRVFPPKQNSRQEAS